MEKMLEGSFLSKLQSADRFQKLEDGWVKDLLLGLDWGPSSTETMDWEDAKEYCAKNGGRLPEVNELHSLVDYTKYKPCINKEIFSDTKTDDWYWTGTTHAGWSGGAWVVGFGYGDVDGYDKGTNGYVRPVRPSK